MEKSEDDHSTSSHVRNLVFVLSVCLVVMEILGLLCNGNYTSGVL